MGFIGLMGFTGFYGVNGAYGVYRVYRVYGLTVWRLGLFKLPGFAFIVEAECKSLKSYQYPFLWPWAD